MVNNKITLVCDEKPSCLGWSGWRARSHKWIWNLSIFWIARSRWKFSSFLEMYVRFTSRRIFSERLNYSTSFSCFNLVECYMKRKWSLNLGSWSTKWLNNIKMPKCQKVGRRKHKREKVHQNAKNHFGWNESNKKTFLSMPAFLLKASMYTKMLKIKEKRRAFKIYVSRSNINPQFSRHYTKDIAT